MVPIHVPIAETTASLQDPDVPATCGAGVQWCPLAVLATAASVGDAKAALAPLPRRQGQPVGRVAWVLADAKSLHRASTGWVGGNADCEPVVVRRPDGLTRCRRLTTDRKTSVMGSEPSVKWALNQLMRNRLQP